MSLSEVGGVSPASSEVGGVSPASRALDQRQALVRLRSATASTSHN